MKKTIREYFSIEDLDGMAVDEMITYLKSFKEKLIEKGMSTAKYSFDKCWECGSDCIGSEFILERDETEEEIQERLAAQQKEFEEFNKRIQAKEIAELKRLKEKYEK